MRSASNILVFASVLLFVLLHTPLLHAQPPAEGTIEIHTGGGLSSEPAIADGFKADLKVVGLVETETPRPVKSETWYYRARESDSWAEGSKPAEVTTYTYKVIASGKGRLKMKLSPDTHRGNAVEKDVEIGTFRLEDTEPEAGPKKDCILKHKEKHLIIHRYGENGVEDKSYSPGPDDECIPILNWGTEKEVLVGTEMLYAEGERARVNLEVTTGIEMTDELAASLSNEGIEFGYGKTKTKKWVWKLKEEEPDTTILTGSFEVVSINPIGGSGSQAEPTTEKQCVECPRCGAMVHSKYQHAPFSCPDDPDLTLAGAGNSKVEGCGVRIWKCPSIEGLMTKSNEYHRVRRCKNLDEAYNTSTCDNLYRHCTNKPCGGWRPVGVEWEYMQEHWDGETRPSNPDESSSSSSAPGLSSSDGSYTASAGDTHEVNLVADGPYSQVYWYVKAPGDTGSYGTQVEIDSGDGVTSDASLSYTFPADAAGEYTITACIYRSDQSVYEESYTVTISGLSSSDGSYTARPGGTHQANLVADGPYSQVYWYVKAPSDTSVYGTQVEIDSGDGAASNASLSYTFPAVVTGDYTITAYIYRSDLSVYEESYTVTVESVAEHTGD